MDQYYFVTNPKYSIFWATMKKMRKWTLSLPDLVQYLFVVCLFIYVLFILMSSFFYNVYVSIFFGIKIKKVKFSNSLCSHCWTFATLCSVQWQCELQYTTSIALFLCLRSKIVSEDSNVKSKKTFSVWKPLWAENNHRSRRSIIVREFCNKGCTIIKPCIDCRQLKIMITRRLITAEWNGGCSISLFLILSCSSSS